MHYATRVRFKWTALEQGIGDDMLGAVLGIESTAHTFSMGMVNSDGVPTPSVSSMLQPKEGGIHPREAADHHADISKKVLEELLSKEELEIGAVAFSQGPGLAPCLRVGASVARSIATTLDVPLIGVNHCVAHIEIGREQCNCEDPVLLYVSGGNTQVISRVGDRYRVLGETLDVGIGNMLDKFARINGMAFPGGPKIEKLAAEWLEKNPNPSMEGLELPYAVHGMDLQFSGLYTAAKHMVEKGTELGAVCWSLQEHAFAASVEVAERALAHTGKTEILLGGGVACNTRLREMVSKMAEDREGSAHVPDRMFCVDNGAMIARLGWLHLKENEQTALEDSAVNPQLRTDQTVITWA